jgi:hypothetical protein
MMKDKHNVEMEDISVFRLERSKDFAFWEEISFKELKENVLDSLETDQVRRFCGIVRTGSPFQLKEYFYRIKSN